MKSFRKRILKWKSKAREDAHQHNVSLRSENSKAGGESFSQDISQSGDPLLTGDTASITTVALLSSQISEPDDTISESTGKPSNGHGTCNGATNASGEKMWPEKPEKDRLVGSTVLHPDPRATESEVEATDIEVGDPPHIARAYDDIPILEQTKLPRGGVSVETKAVGRVQVRLLSLFVLVFHKKCYSF